MASERIYNEYEATRVANAVDTLAANLAGYTPGSPVTPTNDMKAELPSQTTADRISDAVEHLAENFTGVREPVKAVYEETTALTDHEIDEYLYINEHFYKVTASIDEGDPIAVGTNITANLDLPEDTEFNVSGIPGSDTESIFVLDTLDSTSTRDALSANQGRVLNLAKAERNDISSIVCTGSANTTGSTIATGRYFYLNNVLCKAKEDIDNNETFELNTNFTVVTIDEELSALNSNKQSITDNSLTTTDKTVPGAINEINSKSVKTNSANLGIVDYVSATDRLIIGLNGVISSAHGTCNAVLYIESTGIQFKVVNSTSGSTIISKQIAW